MNETTPQWYSDIYGILPHHDQPSVLLLQTAHDYRWSLPHVLLTRWIGFSVVGPVTQAMTKHLGIPITTLRCISETSDVQLKTYQGIFILESAGLPPEFPANGRWVSQADLSDLDLSKEEHRSIIEDFLCELEGGVPPPHRRPWQLPGWYSQAYAWIEAELHRREDMVITSIDQFDSWGLTCLLRAQTDQGAFFFKTAPRLPLFADEPRVMAGLAALFPAHIPAPVAIEPNQGWMLLADFGKVLGRSEEVRKGICRVYGQIQVAAVEHRAHLVNIGCLDRGLEVLTDHADELLSDWRIMACLEADEVQRLRNLRPHLHRLCQQLDSYNIPETLVHGDWGLGNVAGSVEQPLFFDWTEASIAHPFFDMFDIYFEDDLQTQKPLRDAYLAVWTDFEPRNRLLEAWTTAKPLCALYHAISYRNIYINLENPYREAMLSLVRRWLQQVLQSIEAT